MKLNLQFNLFMPKGLVFLKAKLYSFYFRIVYLVFYKILIIDLCSNYTKLS